jgi:spermidine synthase
VVDAYHDEEHVPILASTEFYDAAYLALDERGAMVVNFMDDDRLFNQYLLRMEAAFGGRVLAMKALYDPNIVVIALKGLPARIGWDTLRERAARLEARLDLPFTRYVPRLRSMNPSTQHELLVGPS